jgi:hypothetical protein
MKAIISGSSGLAVIQNGTTAELFFSAKLYEPITVLIHESERVLASANNPVMYSAKDQSDVIAKLKIEESKSTSLLLLLAILDRDVSEENKAKLVECLESELESEEITSYLNAVMFSNGLPDKSISDIPNVISPNNIKSIGLITPLLESQLDINLACDVVNRVLVGYNLDSNKSDYIQGCLTNTGMNYKLLTGNYKGTINTVRFELTSLLELKNIPSYRPIISKIFNDSKGFFKNGLLEKHISIVVPSSVPSTKFDSEITAKIDKSSVHKKSSNVKKQIKNIKKLIPETNLDLAKKYAAELVDSQISGGDKEYAAQSLCQLSE